MAFAQIRTHIQPGIEISKPPLVTGGNADDLYWLTNLRFWSRLPKNPIISRLSSFVSSVDIFLLMYRFGAPFLS
jgi:hypothetical protein